ncbi:hypothetical protein [Shewanella sp. FJAT-52076]|uniref:hypothetical protein n=1 Tax=Shewanella sp. FJAT-52076 TaxID=2864202 RepID=UPI001C6562A1|nr:hypothetical protein [Shewanella sp. FJAT-52076]QYJ76107.1 hypothetical protein K0H79_03720 [Shewanella sp. FJAT-52076]
MDIESQSPVAVAPGVQAHADTPRHSLRLDNQELVKTSFWISQVFMIIATVAGVYLAAKEGLSQAIAFDSLMSQQNNYHLRHALYDELADNVQILTAYADKIEKERPFDIKRHHPAVATFVWENMRYSQSTLETPSEILSASRRFHSQSADIIDKLESKFYGPTYGVKELRVVIASMEQHTLPALKINYEALGESLRQAGVLEASK